MNKAIAFEQRVCCGVCMKPRGVPETQGTKKTNETNNELEMGLSEMIDCDICEQAYHIECVALQISEVTRQSDWQCNKCTLKLLNQEDEAKKRRMRVLEEH
jgi:PHD-finger